MVKAALAILMAAVSFLTSSAALDVFGAASVVAGVALLGGIAWGLIALGVALLLLSMAEEGRKT